MNQDNQPSQSFREVNNKTNHESDSIGFSSSRKNENYEGTERRENFSQKNRDNQETRVKNESKIDFNQKMK